MPDDDNTILVSTDWLRQRLNSPDIRIFDASWYLPTDGRDPRAEYEASHIPGARFFRYRRDLGLGFAFSTHGAATGKIRFSDAIDGSR